MPAIGSDIYLQGTGKAARTLYLSQLVQSSGNTWTLEFGENTFFLDPEGNWMCPQPQQEVVIYYAQNRDFFKQSARVQEVIEADADEDGSVSGQAVATRTVRLQIETRGEPVSADNRECFRISTVFAELYVTVGECDSCRLVDISPTGFAVLSADEHEVGKVLSASAQYNGISASGPVCVMSVRQVRGGQFRYGLRCIDKAFQDEVRKLSMELQRLQLRRLAGRT